MRVGSVLADLPKRGRVLLRIAHREADSVAVRRIPRSEHGSVCTVELLHIRSCWIGQIERGAFAEGEVLAICRPRSIASGEFADSFRRSRTDRQRPELLIVRAAYPRNQQAASFRRERNCLQIGERTRDGRSIRSLDRYFRNHMTRSQPLSNVEMGIIRQQIGLAESVVGDLSDSSDCRRRNCRLRPAVTIRGYSHGSEGDQYRKC